MSAQVATRTWWGIRFFLTSDMHCVVVVVFPLATRFQCWCFPSMSCPALCCCVLFCSPLSYSNPVRIHRGNERQGNSWCKSSISTQLFNWLLDCLLDMRRTKYCNHLIKPPFHPQFNVARWSWVFHSPGGCQNQFWNFLPRQSFTTLKWGVRGAAQARMIHKRYFWLQYFVLRQYPQ